MYRKSTITILLFSITFMFEFEDLFITCSTLNEHRHQYKFKNELHNLHTVIPRESIKSKQKFKRSGDILNILRGIEAVLPTDVVEIAVQGIRRDGYYRSTMEKLTGLSFKRLYENSVISKLRKS